MFKTNKTNKTNKTKKNKKSRMNHRNSNRNNQKGGHYYKNALTITKDKFVFDIKKIEPGAYDMIETYGLEKNKLDSLNQLADMVNKTFKGTTKEDLAIILKENSISQKAYTLYERNKDELEYVINWLQSGGK